MEPSRSDVTQLLQQWSEGPEQKWAAIYELKYVLAIARLPFKIR